jgi:hypothetical protein
MKFYLRPDYIASRLLRIKDMDELKSLAFAGSQIFNFITRGDE